MQGTLTYLAPEIVLLKETGTRSYDKRVDIWALGLSFFEIHTGQQPRWTYTKLDGAYISKMVRIQAFQIYQTRISQRLQTTQDSSARNFLDLIIKMTRYDADKRMPASIALETALNLREGCQGRIVLKSARKRPREE